MYAELLHIFHFSLNLSVNLKSNFGKRKKDRSLIFVTRVSLDNQCRAKDAHKIFNFSAKHDSITIYVYLIKTIFRLIIAKDLHISLKHFVC